MAELTQGDVQHAVQDGIRNLQSSVQRIANQTQQIEYLQRSIQAIQNEVATIERLQMQSANTDQRLLTVVNGIHELRIRMENIERFCGEMSAYMQAQYEAQLEDSQYRAA